jgi:hypothetical protein
MTSAYRKTVYGDLVRIADPSELPPPGEGDYVLSLLERLLERGAVDAGQAADFRARREAEIAEAGTCRMIDGAEDVLNDIARIDAQRRRGVAFPTDRSTASVMRRAGFSDEEIIGRLGYLPESYGQPVTESGKGAEPTRTGSARPCTGEGR